MLKKITFKLGDDRYTVDVIEKTMLITNKSKQYPDFYFLDEINFGNNWIVLETTISKTDEMIWDIEDVALNFKYLKA